MTKRAVDIRFAPDEKLWRAINKGYVSKTDKGIKPSQLRLQISVARSGKGSGSMDSAKPPGAPANFNGVAEVTAERVRSASTELVRVACIDEPTREQPEHALVAVFTDADPSAVNDEHWTAVRDSIAHLMTIVRYPT